MITTCNSDNFDSGKHHESMYVHIYIQLARDITYKCCVLSTFPMHHDLNREAHFHLLGHSQQKSSFEHVYSSCCVTRWGYLIA